MKISLLKQREDFDLIFVETLQKFLDLKYGWSGELGFSFIEKAYQYNVNDLLNIVYKNNIKRNLLSPIVSEFSWHKNPIRRFLQQVYTFSAIRFPFEIFFRSSTFYITDPKKIIPEIVIIPGNHSFRIIDFDSDCCFVICKMGFNKKFLINDATTRANYPWLNVPKIISLDVSYGLYEEERVVGLPLNRLSCGKKIQSCLSICFNNLSKLYKETNTFIPSQEYSIYLYNFIRYILENFSSKLSNNVADKINLVATNLLNKICVEADFDVYLALTHGDFQPANILCGSNVWLIDWEYSKERSVFYDALTFFLKSRFSIGLCDRLVAFEKSGFVSDDNINWVGFDFDCRYFYIFLLEDISLKLDEVLTDSIQDRDNILFLYISELYNFLIK